MNTTFCVLSNSIKTDWCFLEILYYISAPLLVIIGIFGINQISLAKKSLLLSQEDMQTRTQRERARIAIERCDFFAEKIIPLVTIVEKNSDAMKLSNKINSNIITYDKFTKLELLSQITENEIKVFFATISKKHPEQLGMQIDILNKLEAFSTYFNEDIADENVAFPAIHALYFQIVESYYPLISYPNITGTAKSFTNIIHLYHKWKLKVETLQNNVNS